MDLDKLTQSEAAQLLRLSTRQIRNLEAAGMPARGDGAKRWYRWSEVHPWFVQYKQREVSPSDAETWKIREQAARAQKAEIELAASRGEVVRVDDALALLSSILETHRRAAAAIPNRWAPALVGATTVGEMQQRLDEQVREFLTVLQVDLGSGLKAGNSP